MKKIILKIEDNVYREIRQHIGFKGMCGTTYGVVDQFILLLIKSIDEGEKEVKIVKEVK